MVIMWSSSVLVGSECKLKPCWIVFHIVWSDTIMQDTIVVLNSVVIIIMMISHKSWSSNWWSSPHPKLNKYHHYCQCHLIQVFLVDPIILCQYAQSYLIISHMCTCLIFWIILSIVQIIGQLFCQKNMRKGHYMHNSTHAH